MFYLRQPEDTIKGQMYYDLGFNDWIFEIDNTSGSQLAERLIEIFNDYTKALDYLEKSMRIVTERYGAVFKILRMHIKH